MAENYRTEYLAMTLIAASDGCTKEARQAASARAEAVRAKLFGGRS